MADGRTDGEDIARILKQNSQLCNVVEAQYCHFVAKICHRNLGKNSQEKILSAIARITKKSANNVFFVAGRLKQLFCSKKLDLRFFCRKCRENTTYAL